MARTARKNSTSAGPALEEREASRESAEGRTQSSRGDEARQRLIAAGLEVFGKYGYEPASTRQIAEHAGVNLSAITYHFGNKAGLYEVVVRTIAEKLSRPLEPALQEVTSVLESSELTPEQCQEWILRILDVQAQAMLSIHEREANLIVPIWIREQIDPTPAFDVMFNTITSRMLRPCAILMGRLLNRPPEDPECRLRVFALVGQVVVFRLVRLAVLRTAGWEEYDQEKTLTLRKIIRQHSLAVLREVLAHPELPEIPPGAALPAISSEEHLSGAAGFPGS
ncbi:MAG: hypothetical protein OHK0029_16370 [Armatimonadaceae bacterium]